MELSRAPRVLLATFVTMFRLPFRPVLAAVLLLWSMGAGFASGLGLAVRLPSVARLLLSSSACLGALVLAVFRIAGH